MTLHRCTEQTPSSPWLKLTQAMRWMQVHTYMYCVSDDGTMEGRRREGMTCTVLCPCFEKIIHQLFFSASFHQFIAFTTHPSHHVCAHSIHVCSTTAHRLAIAFGDSSAAVVFRPLGFHRLHAITSMHQRAAAPPLGGSKYELNDHLSRLSDLGTHVVLRANTASKDSLRCIDRVSTNDLWACMSVVRSCHFHIVLLNDNMVCEVVFVIDYSTL